MATYERGEFDRLRAIARSVTIADTHKAAPPHEVWAGIAAQVATADSTRRPVADIAARRALRARPARWVLGAAAAVTVAVALLAGIAVSFGGGGNDTEIIAAGSITNEGLPVSFAGSGGVELVSDDGQLALEIDVPELPEADGFYELWLIDTDVAGMQSLGIVRGSGTFPLPNGLDPADFPVVDISVEPADGDPTHSGASVLRGVLDV
jgi:anti-sigma-K factor RskA